jgi:L-ribulokinase
MDQKYVIGIDYGTLSGRALVVSAVDGLEKGTAVKEYTHGVMDRTLTANRDEALPPDFALQVPEDYIEVLRDAVPAALDDAAIDPDDVIGIGIDFTSATVIPTLEDGTPLNELDKFEGNPHAYVKLWKHHGGQDQANRIAKLAQDRHEPWLARYGGLISSELLLPKVLETFEKAPDVYKHAAFFVNALDWIVWRMTGNLVYAAGDSGYKRMYQDGRYPSKDFLQALNPGIVDLFEEKMKGEIRPLGAKAGGLTEEFATIMGLKPGIAVAVGNIDAHVTAAAVNAVEPGQLTAIMGTSSCYVVSGPEPKEVPGMFGLVDGGIVDGLWGFEAGQTGVGDIFAWFVDTCVPPAYFEEAENKDVDMHTLLTQKAADQEVGEHGLVALDWHNGNRSILVDNDLSGLMLGTTITTTPEDQYRALLEATAFGARTIIEAFQNAGVEITEFVAAGGLLKNQFLMHLFADVTRLPLSTAVSAQSGSLGSAVHAAVAAGAYPDVPTAARAMGGKVTAAYVPSEERAKQYDELYAEYKQLHDHFGRPGGNEVMHRLKQTRRKVAARAGRAADN